jgi:hypothetical protein
MKSENTQINRSTRSGLAIGLAVPAVLLVPEAALAFCVEDGAAATLSHTLQGLVGTLILAVSVGGLFAVLRKARAKERSEGETPGKAYRLPAKAVAS